MSCRLRQEAGQVPGKLGPVSRRASRRAPGALAEEHPSQSSAGHNCSEKRSMPPPTVCELSPRQPSGPPPPAASSPNAASQPATFYFRLWALSS